MTREDRRYRVEPFPAARRIVADAGHMGIRRHLIHGLLEFDVTHARLCIREHGARTGETLSFTAFLVCCLAQALAAHPHVQAYRNWRNQLIVFEDVDVVILIEPESGTVAIPHIVREANRKTVIDISREIRAIQSAPRKSVQRSGLLARLGPRAPRFMRAWFFRALRMNPHWLKRYAGTVVLTAVGMFVPGGGWGLGFLPMHTIGLTVGSIVTKPAIIDGQIVPREHLALTISVDHDVVDGAPAARFAQLLKELIESGHGLSDEHAESTSTS